MIEDESVVWTKESDWAERDTFETRPKRNVTAIFMCQGLMDLGHQVFTLIPPQAP